MVPGPNFHLYVIIVGYSQYVSLNIKVGRKPKQLRPRKGSDRVLTMEQWVPFDMIGGYVGVVSSSSSCGGIHEKVPYSQVDSVNVLEATSETLNSA